MEHGKLVQALKDTKAFENVEVVTYRYGTPDIELTIPSKCVFFALVHLNHDCSVDVSYKNYRHDEDFDLDAYPMDNGVHDYTIHMVPNRMQTADDYAREIAFNARMIA